MKNVKKKRLPFILLCLGLLAAGYFSGPAWRVDAGDITGLGMNQSDLYDYYVAHNALTNQIRTALLSDTIRTRPTFGESTVYVSQTGIDYQINGAGYKIASGNITFAGSGVGTAGKYGAWAFEVGTNRTIDIIAPTGISSGYLTSGAAATAIDAVAVTADHARIGTMVLKDPNSAIVPGSSVLSSAATVKIYDYEATTFESIVNAAIGLTGY